MLRRTSIGLVLLSSALLSHGQAPLKFSVTWPASVLSKPFSGRVVVYLDKGNGEPRFGPNWFKPQPMYSLKVHNVAPGTKVLITATNATSFPESMSKLPSGEYKVQAVVDRDLGGRSIGESAGNLYSGVATLQLEGKSSGEVKLTCDKVVEGETFKETDRVKLVKLESKLLSAFHHRPTMMVAAVELPEGYDPTSVKKYPVFYSIHGFGGSAYNASGVSKPGSTSRDGVDFINVLLDANCPLGHSVFADSDNNGPWGAALTKELIPAIEKQFRAIGTPSGRFVGGHSSGGWSSLWLQVRYPDFFGGVWSTSPDPVDFRAFQLVNLYDKTSNLFFDKGGKMIPVARRGTTPWLFNKPFSDMERPIRGEQFGSFDAVFSKRGKNGEPEQMWNRDSGAINQKVVNDWTRYDISLILRRNWKTLGPKLAGKLHIYMGDTDTFYLDGAVRLLKQDLAALKSDAVVEIVPGDHGSMMTRELRKRIDQEVAASARKAL